MTFSSNYVIESSSTVDSTTELFSCFNLFVRDGKIPHRTSVQRGSMTTEQSKRNDWARNQTSDLPRTNVHFKKQCALEKFE